MATVPTALTTAFSEFTACNGKPSRRQLLRGAAAWVGASAFGVTSAVQTQTGAPGSSLRILCTAPGGTIPDIVARSYAEQLGASHSRGVVVDNRAGAAGRIAVGVLKQAAPDGSTLLLAQGAVASVYPYLYDTLAYDPVADLKPLSLAAEAVLGLAVGPAVPDSVTSLTSLVDWIRANPDKATHGSPGVGTLPHLMVALLAREAQLHWQHVPYAGGPQALTDLMAGRLTALALPEGLLRPLQAAGKLRVLATSGPTRSSFLPNVASVVEQGFPRLVMREWFAFFAPGGTPSSLADELSASLQQVAAQPAVKAALAEIGMLALASTGGELRERIAREQPYWRAVVSSTGVRVE
ncbi:MAG: twin-arginine translocation pathway signal protein [Rubrivivax sp.]|jgi:tripartite-type tricarboxylate transporter receptor subunit TctC|nr:twin-arginine translocation pathway signal protein [Rubrivivax sp.]MBK8526104.1 twin-arginine translocation pathway signal protein [Rubrivivax sp.]